MSKMIFLFDTFNGREKAVFVWILIFIFWVLFQKNIFSSVVGIWKAIFQKKMIAIFIAMFVYIYLVLSLFYRMQIWDFSLTKDAVFWIFGSALVLLMNTSKAVQEDHYFIKILQDNLKLVIIFEFIIGLYSFGFLTEMFFVPIVFLIILVSTYAGKEEKFIMVRKFTDFILSFVGIFLIIFSVSQMINNYQGIVTLNNLRSLIFPPLMILAYTPFLYFFTLITTYKIFFVRLNIFLKNDKSLINFAKLEIFKLCFLNLGKINRFNKENTINFLKLRTKDDILSLISKFDK